MSADEHEKDFSVEEQFAGHVDNLAMQWMELGIDPDDFLRCALCRKWLFDPDNNFELADHCQDTVYLIRTANGLDHAIVMPDQGGYKAAEREAIRIKGRLFGIDLNGHEVRMAFYDLAGPPPWWKED